jgi:hypothetical protein
LNCSVTELENIIKINIICVRVNGISKTIYAGVKIHCKICVTYQHVQVVFFIKSLSMAALFRRKLALAVTSHDGCCTKRHCKNNILYFQICIIVFLSLAYYAYFSLCSWYFLLFRKFFLNPMPVKGVFPIFCCELKTWRNECVDLISFVLQIFAVA